MKNELKWFDVEYCGDGDENIQPVLVNDTILYVLYDKKGTNYVFATVYAIHLHWSGLVNQYEFTCGSEEDLIEYLENC